MIGYYPFVVATLFLIYPQWTDQISTTANIEEIRGLLRREKAEVTKSQTRLIDLACAELTGQEKRKLCEDLMIHMIHAEPNNGSLLGRSELVKTGSPRLRSPLFNPDDAYLCTVLPVEGLSNRKNMFWCPHGVRNKTSRDQVHVEGFFVASDLVEGTTAILFRPSSTNRTAVAPFFAMYEADVLAKKKKDLFIY